MPAVIAPIGAVKPGELYDAQRDIHREGMAADRRDRKAEAEFLRGMALVTKRWADAAAWAAASFA